MNIKNQSYFKDQNLDTEHFEDWVKRLEKVNKRRYERISVPTHLGKTHVWGLNTTDKTLETLVIFPGARTTALFWDFDRGLDNLGEQFRIFMVETNGLPNLSEGATPDIKSLDFGHWAAQIFNQLGIEKAYVAGASFGGLICMKLAITNPEMIKSAFLLNPGCLQPFSMKWRNLYYNLLPIINPTRQNVQQFLDAAIFCKPNHKVSLSAEELLIDYEVFALKRYKDKTQKPYYMGAELDQVSVATYVLFGDNDSLFPFEKSLRSAKKHLKNLVDIEVFPIVGHGIETYAHAMAYIGEKITASN